MALPDSHDDDLNDIETTPPQKVLQLPELLERILLNLPFHDLFICQRTHRQFHSIITASKALRQKMFLSHCRQTSDLEVCPAHRRIPKRRRKAWMADIPEQSDVTLAITPPFPHLLSEDSSWWTMFLTNPPARRVWAFFCWSVEGADIRRICSYESRGELVDTAGFTMGKLVEAVLRDRKGKVTVELYGVDDNIESGVAVAKVIERLEEEVGGKARFEGGRVWFLDDEQGQ